MARTTTGAKRIATKLKTAEEGDEMSLVIGGESYRGEVGEVRDDIVGHDLEIAFADAFNVYVDHTAPDDQPHFENTDEDFDVFAVDMDNDEYEVTALVNWAEGMESPDKTLEELEDEEPEFVAEMRDETEDAISQLERCLTEIQEVRKAFEKVEESEFTLADYEEALVELKMESGGRLAVDDW